MRILKSFLPVIAIFFTGHCLAQPFADAIKEFQKQDKINPPPSNAILFVGSSSFTKWTDVSNYFPGYTIINRAFGGSILPDVILLCCLKSFILIILNRW